MKFSVCFIALQCEYAHYQCWAMSLLWINYLGKEASALFPHIGLVAAAYAMDAKRGTKRHNN